MNLAVVPSATSSLPNSNAWPTLLRQARPRHIPRPNSLRALYRVPSTVVVRAYLPATHLPEASGSAFPIKTGSEFPIGITSRIVSFIRQRHHLLPKYWPPFVVT